MSELKLLSPAIRTIVRGYPKYQGGSVALLLCCPGDGRHWINTTTSHPRMEDWTERGGQILGMAPDRETADLVVSSLGQYPKCGASVCAKCNSQIIEV